MPPNHQGQVQGPRQKDRLEDARVVHPSPTPFPRWVIYNDQKVCASEKPPKDLGYIYFYQRVAS